MHGLVDNFMSSAGNEDEDDILDGGNNDDSSDWKNKARKVTDEATEKLEDFKNGLENITPGLKEEELRAHLTKLIAQTEQKIAHKQQKLEEVKAQAGE